MNFEFAEKINPTLEALEFKKALQIVTGELAKLPVTDFHVIVDITFLDQVESAVDWINDFYQIASKNKVVKALYFEMNEFDINTDMWFFDGFSYGEDGGLNLEDVQHMDWLCDYDDSTQNVFKLTGFESLQTAFSEIEEKEENGEWTDELQDARDWCEQMIIAKFMELMREAHLRAKEKDLPWAKIPIYFTEHEYNFIVKSENE